MLVLVAIDGNLFFKEILNCCCIDPYPHIIVIVNAV